LRTSASPDGFESSAFECTVAKAAQAGHGSLPAQFMSRILLGVTGSIAAYKAADLASLLTKAGHDVTCVLTKEALEFVTPLTLRTLSKNPVITDLFAEKEGWQPGHIQLADEAALLLIAPASANVLAALAHGFANDALTAIALATRAPMLIAPAMNGKMWQHPATVRNVETLRGWGVRFVEPAEGLLACGYEGVGRLAPVEEIVAAVQALL
jgi:phosphopantothenoylcysteine synthetase/decarboxylase